MLNLLLTTTFSLTIIMKSTSSAKHAIVISLLQEGYFLCQIQSKTGLGKSTIGRIKKEVNIDKKNLKGEQPAKLSPHDKQFIIRQITTGKLDNAVQAIQFTNTIIPHSVSAQTVKNALKKHNFLCNQAKTISTQKGSSDCTTPIC